MNGQPSQWTQPTGNIADQRAQPKIPVGIVLILVLTGLGAIGVVIGLVKPVLVIGTMIISGVAALFYYLAELAAMIALFYGLIKRLEWGRILGIGYSVYRVLTATVIFIVYMSDPQGVADTMEKMAPGYSNMVPAAFMQIMMGASAIIAWIVGTAVIVYLILKKDYFTSPGTASTPPSINPTQ